MKTSLRFLSSLMAIALLLLASCKSDKSADAADLLATIPSDASLVAVVNLNSLLSKAGPEIMMMKDTSELKPLFDGDYGISLSVAALFRVGYYTYFTGVADDPGKLKSAVEKNYGLSFTSADGIDVAGYIAVADNRFWWNLEKQDIDPKEIKHFLTLDEKQSFATNDYAASLTRVEKEIEGWGSISGLINTSGADFRQKAAIQVALQTIFEDPQSITFSVACDKNKTLAEANILNSKNALAKYQFATSEIDQNVIKAIGGTTDAVMALSIPAKMIEQLKKDAGSRQPSMLGVYLTALDGLDGTTAVGFNADGSAFKGIVSTSGRNIGTLTSFLDTYGINVRIDGKQILIAKGDLKGDIPVDRLAGCFKDAVGGVAVSNNTAVTGTVPKTFETAALTMHTKGNSLLFRITVSYTKNSDK